MITDSKRFGNKLKTLYWMILTSLPLIHIIFLYVNQTTFDLTSFEIYYDVSLLSIDSVVGNALSSLTNSDLVNYIFSYMVSIQIYHLLFDVITFIPVYIHKIMDMFLERSNLDD